MSRFKVSYEGKPLGAAPRAWDAEQIAVAYMRQNRMSPVTITDSEAPDPAFAESAVHIYAYEGTPAVVEARATLAAAGRT